MYFFLIKGGWVLGKRSKGGRDGHLADWQQPVQGSGHVGLAIWQSYVSRPIK